MRKSNIIAVLVILLIGAAAFIIAEQVEAPDLDTEIPSGDMDGDTRAEAAAAFRTQLEARVVTRIGQPIEGFEPHMFMEVYPGLTAADFDDVDASIGRYVYTDGTLEHDLEGEREVHTAAQAVTADGMTTLFENVRERLNMPPTVSAEEVIAKLDAATDNGAERGDPVACTMEAKLCPDGSYVGRVGPDCEFAECPASDVTVCTEEMKQAEVCTEEYAPVCGLVEVQCVTEPCDPVPETFSNGCHACAQGNVVSYTEGACSAE